MTHAHTAAAPTAFSDLLDRAAAAAPACAQTPPRDRARALVAAAARLDESAEELVATAVAETGLADGWPRGEIRRATWQLRLFAEVVAAGLPPPLRDDNPWNIPQRRSSKGLSSQCGSLSGQY